MNQKKDKRQVKKKWTKCETKRLIELYEAQPDLWDPSRANYINRSLKNNLLNEISKSLETTPEEVTGKFHALRTQFNRERSKVNQSKSGSGADEMYTSKWEFFQSLQFLSIGTSSGITYSNMPMNDDGDDDTDDASANSETSHSASNAASCSESRLAKSASRHNKKRKIVPESETDNFLGKALSVLEKEDDEFDVFGNFIASELRQFKCSVLQRTTKQEMMQVLVFYGKYNVPNSTSTQSNHIVSGQSMQGGPQQSVQQNTFGYSTGYGYATQQENSINNFNQSHQIVAQPNQLSMTTNLSSNHFVNSSQNFQFNEQSQTNQMNNVTPNSSICIVQN